MGVPEEARRFNSLIVTFGRGAWAQSAVRAYETENGHTGRIGLLTRASTHLALLKTNSRDCIFG